MCSPVVPHTCRETRMGTQTIPPERNQSVAELLLLLLETVLVGGDAGGCGFCRLIHEPSAHGGLDIKARRLVEKEFNH